MSPAMNCTFVLTQFRTVSLLFQIYYLPQLVLQNLQFRLFIFCLKRRKIINLIQGDPSHKTKKLFFFKKKGGKKKKWVDVDKNLQPFRAKCDIVARVIEFWYNYLQDVAIYIFFSSHLYTQTNKKRDEREIERGDGRLRIDNGGSERENGM